MIARADIPSDTPQRELSRLCQRFPVTAREPAISCIRCGRGTCALIAARDHLTLVVRAADAAELARCQARLAEELGEFGTALAWERRG